MEDEAMWKAMGGVFTCMGGLLFASSLLLTKNAKKVTKRSRPKGMAANASKREGEAYSLKLAALWIAAVVVVIATQAYEWWGPTGYMLIGLFCAVPYVVVPYAFPSEEEAKIPWRERYITKANVWIAIFSFIGNYWYTHYFYRVLKARYTFEAFRLNDVPLCLYLMTHAYFMFYHALSNFVIRWIRDTYAANGFRHFFEWSVIASMSYTTAFGEALTICAFPYYSFEDRNQAYVLGSAFYGIYFLVSYPMFFQVDENAKKAIKSSHYSIQDTIVSALAASMAVLCLLDFVRLSMGVELFAAY
ncbi:cycloeucalenol cycloisomerase [Chloropicon primus]|uniref:Cycloeucalenol cycloisomerase n=1 Tax=Chloropicon primus TaxID=1764295 RepID=A0A5B8MS75_9CHLO|nr:cycloeucalenol cycloisomerase [Chloropicon primus]UPR01350.1 cycloeucalenol cycloisomerase [Chloropicon primus]|eukprot:QDZ22132.1 cycloeucalenol cycloisomerase [Chloropicon primus]